MSRNSPELEDDENYVYNRSGQKEPVQFSKIVDRVETLLSSAYGRRLKVNRVQISQEVISRFRSGMRTVEVDDLIVQVCLSLSSRHPDYSALAGRILINNLQKRISKPFAQVYVDLARSSKSRISPGFLNLVSRFADCIEGRIDYSRDYLNVGFSVATLMRSYLLKDPETEEIAELPQHMYMRVALALQCMSPSTEDPNDRETWGGEPIQDDELLAHRLEVAFRLYDLLSLKKVSHASPTIFNAGTYITQYSSCFQAQVDDDLRNLYEVLTDTAMMSKTAGGVSVSLDRMRAKGALIRSSGGKSTGVEKYICLLQRSQVYANQGGNRPGAFAVYLSPHHADILTFLEMGLPTGARFEHREDGHLLKYAVWIPDRFMLALEEEIAVRRRLAAGEDVPEAERERAGLWHLFSPDRAPGLEGCYDERSPWSGEPGGTYSDLYDTYVSEGRYERTVKASEVMKAIVRSLGLTGTPYLLFKDNVNRQSNLAQAGGGRTVVSSNLCAEVTIPCLSREGKPDETLYSVCNLAAVNLPSFVVPDMTAAGGVRFDYVGVIDAAAALATNLDNIIDLNHVPAEGCRRSNQYFRAIGIGVMGLADVFHLFGYEFGSPQAKRLDMAIHACIYYGATQQSSELARVRGNFPAYAESAAARGKLQPDLCVEDGILNPAWAEAVEAETGGVLTPEMWDELRRRVGPGPDGPGYLRNGYVTALMPTATSSNAAGVNECFEPYTTHMYSRKTLAGEFTLLNPHLVRELEKLKLWDENTADILETTNGSVAGWDGESVEGAPTLPEDVRRRFRTARELDQLEIISHAAYRNPFVSQSQSMNLYWERITLSSVVEALFAAWRSGLSTGAYYSHSSPASGALGRGGAPSRKEAKKPAEAPACRLGPGGPGCEACSV